MSSKLGNDAPRSRFNSSGESFDSVTNYPCRAAAL